MPENHGKVTIPARSWVDRPAASEDAQEDALAVLNDETLLAARQYHVDRLEAVYAGETLAEPFRLWGLYGESRIDLLENPIEWVDQALESLAAEAARILNSGILGILGTSY